MEVAEAAGMPKSRCWSPLFVTLLLVVVPTIARAQTVGPITPTAPVVTPVPVEGSQPRFAETERTLWNSPGGAWLNITRLVTLSQRWQFATHWAVVGTAGNRLLWYRAETQETNLWKLDDDGRYLSFVSLTAPGPGYVPRSITLGNVFVGACYDRDDSQRYYVLWTDPAGGVVLQYMYGDGSATTTYPVTMSNITAPTTVIGAAATWGTKIMLVQVSPPGAASRIELRYLEWNTAQASYQASTVTYQRDVPAGYVPVSVNARYTAASGWVDQVYFRTATGSGALWDIAWQPSPRAFLGERIIQPPASGWSAKGHAVNPSICP